jgi:hypothetical protein
MEEQMPLERQGTQNNYKGVNHMARRGRKGKKH